MQKVFLIIFTVLFLIATPKAWAAGGDVYRFSCLPEVGQAQVTRYSTDDKGRSHYFQDPANMEEKGYHNPLWKLGNPEMYTHECLINGQQLIIKMDAVKYSEEKNALN